MDRGSEFEESGIEQAQIKATERLLQVQDGLEAQQRYKRTYHVESFFGPLLGTLLVATLVLLIVDRSLVGYAGVMFVVATLGYVAVKVWNTRSTRKKRAEDLRLMAIERDKTENETEAKNA
ncbi:hypothetical protein [Roseibium sp. MMSF_3412]|uniref:hypothetical protein n=1 Tax=Roseibium sp. MMSF_3412 TaxID=3046712 RepID=UPI00273D96F7|nr:hypothetical protein [Roseibium sp. MMSF_3412]